MHCWETLVSKFIPSDKLIFLPRWMRGGDGCLFSSRVDAYDPVWLWDWHICRIWFLCEARATKSQAQVFYLAFSPLIMYWRGLNFYKFLSCWADAAGVGAGGLCLEVGTLVHGQSQHSRAVAWPHQIVWFDSYWTKVYFTLEQHAHLLRINTNYSGFWVLT